MSFVCEVRGCDKEAKVARKCMKHALEAVRKEHGLEDREEETDEKEPKEKTMGEKKCSECGQQPKEGERLYREQCTECRSKGKAESKPRKKKEVSTPAPSMGEGRGEGEGAVMPARGKSPLSLSLPLLAPGEFATQPSPPPMASTPAGDVVGKLMSDLFMYLNKAKEIHGALTTIKNLTGADITIPEINF